MSATGRGVERQKQDAYMTPLEAIESLISKNEVWTPDNTYERQLTLLDPCMGDGWMINAIRSKLSFDKAVAMEINPNNFDRSQVLADTIITDNYLTPNVILTQTLQKHGKFTVGVTNPPYGYKDEDDNDVTWIDFYYRMRRQCETVVLLLPLSVFGALCRKDFWDDKVNKPSDLIVLSRRPSFRYAMSEEYVKNKHGKKGSDSSVYAWFVWRDTHNEVDYTVIHHA